MSKAQSLRSGGAWLLAGEITEKGCTFLRLILLTQIISKEEVGLASVLILILSFFEQITDLGVHNLLLQAPDSDDPKLLRSVHGVMAVRGLGLGGVMFLAAPLLAKLFYPPGAQGEMLGGEAHLADALRWFALVPVLRGFSHYDNNLSLKQQNYRPIVLITMIPSLAMVALAYPAADYFKSYYAMLALIIVQEVTKLVVTHLVAHVGWRVHFSKPFWDRIVAYGGPLMINGFLMYLYSLGDRTLMSSSGRLFGPIFGHEGYPPATWADYTVAVSLAAAPVTMVARLMARVALPLLAKIQLDSGRFAYRYRSALAMAAVGGALIGVGLTLAGGTVALVFGKDYDVAGRFMGPIALMQALALLKIVPTSALLARGDTKGTLVMTLWRTSVILLMVLVAAFLWDMWWMAVCGAFGEALSLVVVYSRLRRTDKEFRFDQWKSFFFVVAANALAMGLDHVLARGDHAIRVLATAGLCGVTLVLAHFVFPRMLDQLRRMARGRLASDGPEAPATASVAPDAPADTRLFPAPGVTRQFEARLTENLNESFNQSDPVPSLDKPIRRDMLRDLEEELRKEEGE